MGALAEELGISRTTLYTWVGSKNRPLGEVLWSFAANGVEQAIARAKGTGADWRSGLALVDGRAAVAELSDGELEIELTVAAMQGRHRAAHLDTLLNERARRPTRPGRPPRRPS